MKKKYPSKQNDIIEQVLQQEDILNNVIVDSVFRYFLLALLCLCCGFLFQFLFNFGSFLRLGNSVWLTFTFLSLFFGLAQKINYRQQIAIYILPFLSFSSGVFLSGYLYFLSDEFGGVFIARALLASCLIFFALAILGWQKSSFTQDFLIGKKIFLPIFIVVFSVINFLNFGSSLDFFISFIFFVFISFQIVSDFQKLRYLPKRGVITISTQFFFDLVLSFCLILKLLSFYIS